jgi:hypothetical protein
MGISFFCTISLKAERQNDPIRINGFIHEGRKHPFLPTNRPPLAPRFNQRLRKMLGRSATASQCSASQPAKKSQKKRMMILHPLLEL